MDNVQGMRMLDDECVDLTVTSPPYDDLRNYKGFSFDFENVAHGLYRVVKQGGIVVWIVSDSTKDYSESGTSFGKHCISWILALIYLIQWFGLKTVVVQ